MSIPDYRFVISDTTLGTNLCEAPLTLTGPMTRLLNGIGQLNATLPVDHATATPDNIEGDRTITAYRDDLPVWNGPITMHAADRLSGVVTIQAREAHWHFTARVLEVDYINTDDIFNLMRDLYNNAVGKGSTGATGGGTSINAALPNFVISPSSGAVLAGASKTVGYKGADCRYFWDIFVNDFVNDPTHGIDVRMDYTTGSTREQCQRHFSMAYPNEGTTRDQVLREHVLSNYGYTSDRERAATRVHVIGQGYVSTMQNTGSITAGDELLDRVYSRTDTSSSGIVDAYASDMRRLAQPPVKNYTAYFTPGDDVTGALPYNFCDLGDTLTLDISGPPILAISDSRRVIEIDILPNTASTPESVGLVFNLPLDRLGA